MNYKTTSALNSYFYKKEIDLVEEVLKLLEIVPLSDIWIYPNWPYGFEAVVGVKGGLCIVKRTWNEITVSYESSYGIRKNGTFIRK